MSKAHNELARFVLNGIAATAVHFAALRFAMSVLHVPLASAATAFGVVFGISASFLGNRYFVFRASQGDLGSQFTKFIALYATTATFHAAVLFIWTDLLEINYTSGFLVATAFLTLLSYVGNKRLVFAR